MTVTESTTPSHFIREIVKEDNSTPKYNGRVLTRFPPEPNGYLHIGHAKSICLNFTLAQEFGGGTNLRFDDTNPTKEEQEYVDSIQADIQWLGFNWQGKTLYASDYFDQLYQWAVQLIHAGKAYVDDLTPDEMRQYRGTLTEPGKNSPYRDRSAAENLDLFERMKAGEFPNGTRVLRAKIDMSSPNINLRDPVMYRILHATHHRTGDKWCIYPTYDWAHGQSDYIEGITHSICTLEFEAHRPLYEWCLEALELTHPRPQQIEFARLELTYTIMSKRKLLRLVTEGHVSDWDDPRMPTISGMRRRGYTAAAIRRFCDLIGVAKANSKVDFAMLEHCVRDDLNQNAPRGMAILNPLRVVIENYPEDAVEELEVVNHPQRPEMGKRIVPFSKVFYMERDDFMENPPNKFFRMAPGREVRLNQAYYVTCTDVVKGENGEVVELRCTYDPQSKGGSTPDNRKVKATLHWVSAAHAVPVEVRLYDNLFTKPNPEEDEDFRDNLNPQSLQVVTAQAEPALAEATPGSQFQFVRQGYFCVDIKDSKPDAPVFNRTLGLKDTYAKTAD